MGTRSKRGSREPKNSTTTTAPPPDNNNISLVDADADDSKMKVAFGVEDEKIILQKRSGINMASVASNGTIDNQGMPDNEDLVFYPRKRRKVTPNHGTTKFHAKVVIALAKHQDSQGKISFNDGKRMALARRLIHEHKQENPKQHDQAEVYEYDSKTKQYYKLENEDAVVKSALHYIDSVTRKHHLGVFTIERRLREFGILLDNNNDKENQGTIPTKISHMADEETGMDASKKIMKDDSFSMATDASIESSKGNAPPSHLALVTPAKLRIPKEEGAVNVITSTLVTPPPTTPTGENSANAEDLSEGKGDSSDTASEGSITRRRGTKRTFVVKYDSLFDFTDSDDSGPAVNKKDLVKWKRTATVAQRKLKDSDSKNKTLRQKLQRREDEIKRKKFKLDVTSATIQKLRNVNGTLQKSDQEKDQKIVELEAKISTLEKQHDENLPVVQLEKKKSAQAETSCGAEVQLAVETLRDMQHSFLN
mmetsp:Transcript_8152/g.19686  ORF Transcript_8152/g.19686 Transcript_8152/m.19686 type:complete len:479 (-) Transcript_8152:150-1586(-)